MSGNRRRARQRPELYLHGSDFYRSTPASRARVEAENPNITTAQWRNALLALVNESGAYVTREVPPDHLLEALRRATLLLDQDARTAPTPQGGRRA